MTIEREVVLDYLCSFCTKNCQGIESTIIDLPREKDSIQDIRLKLE